MTNKQPEEKLHCWEFKKCGREPGGDKVTDLCECPAAVVPLYPGGGNNGDCLGRRCWRAAGTLCGGQIQGTFAKKVGNCRLCDFYQKVKKEEGDNFVE